MLSERNVFDVTIIGGGPVGLYGVFYAGLRGMKSKILDALPELGGQLVTLYPEKTIFDVGGIPKILARDLAEQLIKQASTFHPAVCLDEKIVAFTMHKDGDQSVFELTSEQKVSHFTKTIVLTAGIGAFKPKKLEVPGLAEFEGRGVYYFVNDKSVFKGRDILIVGGGDSAVEWSLNLLDIANHISLIHRSDQFRAHEEKVEELLASSVDVRTFHELKTVKGISRIEEAVIFNNKTLAESSLNVDSIILNLGYRTDLGPIKKWGLDLDKGGIVVNSRMETNIKGIYAAGDVASHPGKLKLISTGFGEVATAVNFAKNLISPISKVYPGHSSDLKDLNSGTLG